MQVEHITYNTSSWSFRVQWSFLGFGGIIRYLPFAIERQAAGATAPRTGQNIVSCIVVVVIVIQGVA